MDSFLRPGEARSALFRDVNERIAENTRGRAWDYAQAFFCECDDPLCMHALRLTESQYEAARAAPSHLVTFIGHDRSH